MHCHPAGKFLYGPLTLLAYTSIKTGMSWDIFKVIFIRLACPDETNHTKKEEKTPHTAISFLNFIKMKYL